VKIILGYDDIRKLSTFLLTLAGLFIFYSVIAVKIDVVAKQTQTRIDILEAEIQMDNMLEQRMMMKFLEEKKNAE
jgi:hypothetical protein